MTEMLEVEIKNMTEAQLKEMLQKLRENRKRGYASTPKARRRETNPYADLDPSLAQRILDELVNRKE